MTSRLSGVVSQARAEARARREELGAQLANPGAVADRLREEAAAAAESPLAYDQILSLALRDAAEPPDSTAAALKLLAPPDPIEQLALRREVFTWTGADVLDLDVRMAAAHEARRGASRIGRDPATLALYLRRAAVLNRELWDHPAIDADPPRRAAMLAAVEALETWADRIERVPPDAAWPRRSPSPRLTLVQSEHRGDAR